MCRVTTEAVVKKNMEHGRENLKLQNRYKPSFIVFFFFRKYGFLFNIPFFVQQFWSCATFWDVRRNLSFPYILLFLMVIFIFSVEVAISLLHQFGAGLTSNYCISFQTLVAGVLFSKFVCLKLFLRGFQNSNSCDIFFILCWFCYSIDVAIWIS